MLVLSAEVLFDLMFEIKDRGVTVDGGLSAETIILKMRRQTHTHIIWNR